MVMLPSSIETPSEQLKGKKGLFFSFQVIGKLKRLVFDFTLAPCTNSSHSKANNHARFK